MYYNYGALLYVISLERTALCIVITVHCSVYYHHSTLLYVFSSQRTALYLACAEGRPKCVDLLIKRGAMVTYSYKQNGVEKDMSCLNAAIDGNHKYVG